VASPQNHLHLQTLHHHTRLGTVLVPCRPLVALLTARTIIIVPTVGEPVVGTIIMGVAIMLSTASLEVAVTLLGQRIRMTFMRIIKRIASRDREENPLILSLILESLTDKEISKFAFHSVREVNSLLLMT